MTKIYYFDANICIAYMKGKNKELRYKIDEIPPECIKIPAIVKGELLTGAEKVNAKMKLLLKLSLSVNRTILYRLMILFC